MPEYAYNSLMTFETKYPDLYNKTIAIAGATASGITDSVLKYVSNENIIVVSGVSTSPALTNRTNFCRTVPDDNQQIDVITKIMKTFNWNSAILLYSNSNYGINACKALLNVPYLQLFPKMIKNNFDEIASFVETQSQTDIVITFASPTDLIGYFNALKIKDSKMKKLYIGSDYWVFIGYLFINFKILKKIN